MKKRVICIVSIIAALLIAIGVGVYLYFLPYIRFKNTVAAIMNNNGEYKISELVDNGDTSKLLVRGIRCDEIIEGEVQISEDQTITFYNDSDNGIVVVDIWELVKPLTEKLPKFVQSALGFTERQDLYISTEKFAEISTKLNVQNIDYDMFLSISLFLKDSQEDMKHIISNDLFQMDEDKYYFVCHSNSNQEVLYVAIPKKNQQAVATVDLIYVSDDDCRMYQLLYEVDNECMLSMPDSINIDEYIDKLFPDSMDDEV